MMHTLQEKKRPVHHQKDLAIVMKWTWGHWEKAAQSGQCHLLLHVGPGTFHLPGGHYSTMMHCDKRHIMTQLGGSHSVPRCVQVLLVFPDVYRCCS